VKRYGDDSYIPIRYRISGQIIPCLPGDDLPGDDPIKEEIDNPPGPDPDSDNVSVSVELPPWNSHNVNPIF
jgi:hypothetical protein